MRRIPATEQYLHVRHHRNPHILPDAQSRLILPMPYLTVKRGDGRGATLNDVELGQNKAETSNLFQEVGYNQPISRLI